MDSVQNEFLPLNQGINQQVYKNLLCKIRLIGYKRRETSVVARKIMVTSLIFFTRFQTLKNELMFHY